MSDRWENEAAQAASTLPAVWQESDATRQARLQWLRRNGWQAQVYADWVPASYCSLPRPHTARILPAVERSSASRKASFTARGWRHWAHWTIADCSGQGAAAYRQPASAPAAYSPFGAMVLSALARLRRWSRYADSPD